MPEQVARSLPLNICWLNEQGVVKGVHQVFLWGVVGVGQLEEG